jgi:hypothetical protein
VGTTNGFHISNYRHIGKGTLVDTFTLHLASGMIIHNVMLHLKADKRWIGLPAREYQVNGERKFARIIEFTDKSTAEKFMVAAMAALESSVTQ